LDLTPVAIGEVKILEINNLILIFIFVYLLYSLKVAFFRILKIKMKNDADKLGNFDTGVGLPCGSPTPVARHRPRISRIPRLIVSALVPKMACITLPTSSTPAAPSCLRRGLSTLVLSLTATFSRVMQASWPRMLSGPPKALITSGSTVTPSDMGVARGGSWVVAGSWTDRWGNVGTSAAIAINSRNIPRVCSSSPWVTWTSTVTWNFWSLLSLT
jgi:hypothetical protein